MRAPLEGTGRLESREEHRRWYLETHGVPCLVPVCKSVTIRDTGLCDPHHTRAQNWMFTPEQLKDAFDPGACESCGDTEALVLDHEHGMPCESEHRYRHAGCPECFRGILCNGCNSAIGFAKDDPSTLRGAARYLEAKLK